MKFSNWKEPIPEAYFPKLDSLTSARGWPPRQSGMRWQDLNRPADGLNITVADMEKWRANIQEAISTGRVTLVSTFKLFCTSQNFFLFAHCIREHETYIINIS